jgi:outer membrane protein OmpU
MKKVLFASTALVAFAGAAAADVTISGFAEMGIVDAETAVLGEDGTIGTNEDDDAQFFTDISVTFTMAGETDGGLLFGASVDLEEAEGGIANDTEDDFAVFLSGAFGTITMGDTDGALDWAMTEVLFNSGSINDAEEHGGYSGNSVMDGFDDADGQILRYDYTVGAFGVALSVDLDDDGDTDGEGPDEDDDTYQIGFRYSLDFGGASVDLGLGYADSDNSDAIGVSAAATLANGLAFGINYTDFDNVSIDNDDFLVDQAGDAVSYGEVDDHIGVGIGYTTGAISLSANYGEFNGDDVEVKGFGLTAGYDLGGGAIVQFGYGRTDVDVDGGDDENLDNISLGVRMNF